MASSSPSWGATNPNAHAPNRYTSHSPGSSYPNRPAASDWPGPPVSGIRIEHARTCAVFARRACFSVSGWAPSIVSEAWCFHRFVHHVASAATRSWPGSS